MGWEQWLVVVSMCISASGMIFYIRDMAKGTTRPNLVSFGLWAAAPIIAAGAGYFGGADIWPTLRTLMSGLVPTGICIAAFVLHNKFWKISWFDVVCGMFSLGALGAWLLASSHEMAVVLAVLSDVWATVPTLMKAWSHPKTETGMTYVTSFTASILVFPAIPDHSIVNIAFPLYLFFGNGLLLLVVFRKKIKKFFAF
jgi:hypothetical protein